MNLTDSATAEALDYLSSTPPPKLFAADFQRKIARLEGMLSVVPEEPTWDLKKNQSRLTALEAEMQRRTGLPTATVLKPTPTAPTVVNRAFLDEVGAQRRELEKLEMARQRAPQTAGEKILAAYEKIPRADGAARAKFYRANVGPIERARLAAASPLLGKLSSILDPIDKQEFFAVHENEISAEYRRIAKKA